MPFTNKDYGYEEKSNVFKRLKSDILRDYDNMNLDTRSQEAKRYKMMLRMLDQMQNYETADELQARAHVYDTMKRTGWEDILAKQGRSSKPAYYDEYKFMQTMTDPGERLKLENFSEHEDYFKNFYKQHGLSDRLLPKSPDFYDQYNRFGKTMQTYIKSLME